MGQAVAKMWSFARFLTSKTFSREGQVGDGREDLLLKEVLKKAERNPESVLRTIDQFAQRSWLMNIGDNKGMILKNALAAAKPKVVMELGAYVGYSATLIGSKLEHGGKLISLEMSSANASIARQVVEHAGVSDKVTIVEGILIDKIEEVKELLLKQNVEYFDFIFLDHDKTFYLSDFLLLKEHGLVRKGTILFADNMRIPGSPMYRAYMDQHSDEYETIEHDTQFEYFQYIPDSIFITICK